MFCFKKVKPMDGERTILHCDMNNFFASVECRPYPELRGRPVAVCGDPQNRHGIILAKNDIAKRYGVQTGEKIMDAKERCPTLTLLPASYRKYDDYSGEARALYKDYTDQVESFGLDECWLDVTCSTTLFGGGKKIADELRARMKKELGLTISVGVSHSKTFAKMGSDYRKPDATTVIDRSNYRKIIWSMDISSLLYVGPATAKRMQFFGIESIGDLARADPKMIDAYFGKNGLSLQQTALGKDCSVVTGNDFVEPPKSVSNGITAPRDLANETDAAVVLSVLCDSVAARLRAWGRNCGRVSVYFRSKDLHVGQKSLEIRPTCLASEIFKAALALYREAIPPGSLLRSLTVSTDKLTPIGSRQISFLDDSLRLARREQLADAVDGIREKHGGDILRPCLALLDPELSGFHPKEDPRFKVFASRRPPDDAEK